MTDNAHTVNITARPYHHGDLRAALVRAGLELVGERQTHDLSLREVARAAGVSANAVYRHFPDKQALLAAVAAEGLSQLAKAQRQAAAGESESGRSFALTGQAYVTFALEHPALFRLIFSAPRSSSTEAGSESDAGRLLRENAAAAAANAEAAPTVAVRAWALAHGLAMLLLDGRIEPSDTLLEQVFDTEQRS